MGSATAFESQKEQSAGLLLAIKSYKSGAPLCSNTHSSSSTPLSSSTQPSSGIAPSSSTSPSSSSLLQPFPTVSGAWDS